MTDEPKHSYAADQEPLSDDELAELSAFEDSASPAPWSSDGSIVLCGTSDNDAMDALDDDDAYFIALSRNKMRRLLEMVRRLKKEDTR